MDSLKSLPPLREVIASFGLQAKKSLGQNFILNGQITDKIASLASLTSTSHVLEIGPGPGGLTRSLLKTEALQVTAIERDERCLRALEELCQVANGRLTLIAADALKLSLSSLKGGPFEIIANLPYNIGTRLLLNWCQERSYVRRMTLMFQKEVADRLTALPHTPHYGRLSVWVQWQMQVRQLLILPPQVFSPAPKVMSVVVELIPRPTVLHPANPARLQKLLMIAFQQRRKMLRRSLKSLASYNEAWFTEANISPTARPEELSVQEFCRLSDMLKDESF